MTTMTRTDVHAPRNLVTEDYDYVGCGEFPTADSPGYSPLAHEGAYLLNEGWGFAENHSAGSCYHCGAHLRYYAILKHVPTHSLIRVGETCLMNRFERASADFHALRKRAELDRKAQRIKRTRARWFAIDEDRQVAYEWADYMVREGHYGYEGMRHNFVSKINRYGETSDKFVRAIMRDMVRTERREDERAAREAVEAEWKRPVVEGRGEIVGEVVSVKFQENDYGSRHVMTVKDDRGFLVWGTVPSGLGGVERGDRVRFTGTVERSDRDESFGFFKRPSKAGFIETEVAV